MRRPTSSTSIASVARRRPRTRPSSWKSALLGRRSLRGAALALARRSARRRSTSRRLRRNGAWS
eukprot:12658460-Alexandrium_andersonii.AAC.1